MQKIYNLQDGVFKINEIIENLIEKKEGNIVVLIAGGSASGKTSQVAKKVLEKFKDIALLLSMDNYYRGKEYYKKNNLNFDQPEALNIDLFLEHLTKLKNGETVKIPDYDFLISTPIFNAIEVKPKKIIIIEGLYTLLDDISKLGDLKVFVDLGTHGRILRRILRDVKRTGQRPKDILNYFLDTVEPMNDKYIEPTKINADFIISNEYNPFLESGEIKIKDMQKKYNVSGFSESKMFEILLRSGAQYLGDLEYTDYYFSPDYIDGRIVGDSEIILVRKIAFGKYIFMYKGPLNKTKDYEERCIINFFVDGDTVDEFREIYGDDIKIVSRKRSTYFYSSVLILVDSFENGEKILELKFENFDKKTKDKISSIFKELCLGEFNEHCKLLIGD
ncbi:MAG: uridine kinase [Candidatus Gracilibacteria bacterium]|nr:uridine kinase [Candidatus Gracilibacteria bacterium]